MRRRRNHREPPSVEGENPVRLRRRIVFLAGLVLLVIAANVFLWSKREALEGLFRPPAVVLREAYPATGGTSTLDHVLFGDILHRFVDEQGRIDYRGLLADPDALDSYIAAVKDVSFESLGRDGKLALLLNAYNAFTTRLILDYYPIRSIEDIPADKRWDDKRWRIGSHRWSLNQIEQEQIRPKFIEPRIHFALVCAAMGCPPLRNEAYQPDRIAEQLEDQALYLHTHPQWFRFDAEANTVYLTKLYAWYGGDFEQVAGSVLAYASRYCVPLQEVLHRGATPRVVWLDYDWTLNDQNSA